MCLKMQYQSLANIQQGALATAQRGTLLLHVLRISNVLAEERIKDRHGNIKPKEKWPVVPLYVKVRSTVWSACCALVSLHRRLHCLHCLRCAAVRQGRGRGVTYTTSAQPLHSLRTTSLHSLCDKDTACTACTAAAAPGAGTQKSCAHH